MLRIRKFWRNLRGAASGDLLRKLGFASGNLIASRQAHSDAAIWNCRFQIAATPQLDSVEGSSLFGTSEPLSNSGVESAATVVAGLESGFLLRVVQATCVQNTLLKEKGDTKTALIGNIPG